MTDLLNKTICTGIRLTAVVEQDKKFTVVGYKITKEDRDLTRGIPISSPSTCDTYLGLTFRLAPDPEGQYLMVVSSVMLLARDPEVNDSLFHYDYERNKEHNYPEAHLHICATSPNWEALGEDRALSKLHFPVGGRRFRPTLEEFIEFLIIEGFVAERKDARKHIKTSREEFQKLQLRAAIRRDPEVAREALARVDAENSAKV